ncbi:MAG: methylenetetrahydrofolate--tRNA-(uracil(54)-C(5))-methyltransferase (FADH(2)-oxidizing) TrmFO [Armatimonadota bacterium]
MQSVIIIGGGLAGCEAAWQAAERGVDVLLYEMRPVVMTPAHESGQLAELVCSNSLKSEALTSTHGALKEEMRQLGSILLPCADETRVPAGQALAVDRERFSELVTKRIESRPRITVCREEIKELPPDRPLIIATGPLTSDALVSEIARITGMDRLFFYDAIAPSVYADSIDRNICFAAARYDKGTPYLNCPFTKEQYFEFRDALLSAELAPLHEFEKKVRFYEGCLPIEELASRGAKTLAFGPMKPVGLRHPKTGENYFAVVQLRQENVEGTVYGLVGFQTRLKWPDQERVFRMIPGLENAKFARLGQIHRNTYIDSPQLLSPTLQLKSDPEIFFAGQLTGVEGYMESAASGIIAGINAARLVHGKELVVLPEETMLGALLKYISSTEVEPFQPMNVNFGILPPLIPHEKKDEIRRAKLIERALTALQKINNSPD